jgi:hypothetical protein
VVVKQDVVEEYARYQLVVAGVANIKNNGQTRCCLLSERETGESMMGRVASSLQRSVALLPGFCSALCDCLPAKLPVIGPA